jgi:phosphatidate cytidylyltransferase
MAGELVRRVAVAAIGIPIGVVAIYLGGWYFGALLAGIAAVGSLELYGLARQGGIEPFDVAGAAASAFFVLSAVSVTPAQAGARSWNVAILFLIVVVGLTIRWRGVDKRPLAAAAVTVAGALFVGGTLAYAVWLRELPAVSTSEASQSADLSAAWQGTALVAFPLLITWLNDTLAYFVGRSMGKHKLAPRVSPSKTVEGAGAGLLGGVVVAILLGRGILGPQLGISASPILWGIGGVLIATVAQLGDLAESLIKREARVKDSGSVFPGHGGVLDRFDALFFAIPVSYWFLRWVGLH